MSARDAILETLRSIGPDLVTTDPSDLEEFGRDWTRVISPAPLAVVRPRTNDEVIAIVKACHLAKVAMVPSGGRTGLAGGAIAANGEVVISMSRMSKIGPIDVVGKTVHVEAGAVTQAVHEATAEHGLTWPVDFASKGSSHVGGNIATNAGGIKVIRYGLTRHWVLGLDVVLADGTFLRVGGALEKNNTGMDLKQLFIGSEGTLGIITGATLKLTPTPKESDVFLFAVDDLAAVVRLFRETHHAPFTLSAYEFFTDACLQRVSRHRKLTSPLEAQASHYVLLEAERVSESASEAWLTSLFERGLVLDGTMAQHESQASQLWALRESISESLSATGLPHKNDISLPVAALEAFTSDMTALLAANYPGFEVCVFGHIGDGNLHVNVMKPDAMSKPEFVAATPNLDHAMFALVRAHGGSISAEHGIGLLKKPYLHYARSAEELATMRAIKRALDPENRMNPGKIIDM
jgi:glycolate oxidase subunit GlcD